MTTTLYLELQLKDNINDDEIPLHLLESYDKDQNTLYIAIDNVPEEYRMEDEDCGSEYLSELGNQKILNFLEQILPFFNYVFDGFCLSDEEYFPGNIHFEFFLIN